MWLRILELALMGLFVYGVFRWVMSSLRTVDTENKIEELESLEEENKMIVEANKKYKNVRSKKDGIAKFKKQ